MMKITSNYNKHQEHSRLVLHNKAVAIHSYIVVLQNYWFIKKLLFHSISAVAGSSSLKDGSKRLKSSMDEIIIGKNHVNPALILHLAKSTKVWWFKISSKFLFKMLRALVIKVEYIVDLTRIYMGWYNYIQFSHAMDLYF